MTGKALRAAAVVLLAGGLFAFVLYIRSRAAVPVAPPPPAPPPVRTHPFAFRSNAECATCHSAVAEECSKDEHASAWFNGALFPQDPKRTECVSCHASEPILEIGLDKMPVVRQGRFEEGIGCIECHRMNDGVRGPLPTREAACNPVQDARFTDVAACAPCHAPHGTLDEWRASSWGKKGVTCQACHMPEVERPSADGGPPRKVRTHRMISQRNPEFLRKAVSVAAGIEGGKLVVAITNDNTGHSFPGEIFNREAFLSTQIVDAEGNVLADHRESIKTPPRPKRGSEESTQIKAGETRTYSYDLPPGKWKATIVLGYKLFVFGPDDRALKVWEGTLER